MNKTQAIDEAAEAAAAMLRQYMQRLQPLLSCQYAAAMQRQKSLTLSDEALDKVAITYSPAFAVPSA